MPKIYKKLSQSFDSLEESIKVVTRQSGRKNGKKAKKRRSSSCTSVNSIHNSSPSRNSNTNPSSSNNNPNPSSSTEIDFDEMASATFIPTKFVGTIKDPNDPDKALLESYDVHRFLADVDAQIVSKKIATDADKIKQAHLFISSDKGDAKALVLSPAFENVTYDEFKELCKLTWQREEYKDPFYNLIKFKNLKKDGTAADFIANLYEYGKRLKDDIINNRDFPKEKIGDKENMVEIQHVINYFAYGLMYENFSETFKNAFKECTIDPKQGPIKTFSNVKEIAVRKQTRIDQETVLYSRGKERKATENNNKNKNAGQTNPGYNSNKNKPNPTQQAQPQKQYSQGHSYSTQNVQGYQRGQSNYRGRGRGRGYGHSNYQNQNQYKVVCFKCRTPGHKADTCRSCHYCCSHGHWIADCPIKYRDENSNRNQHSNNKDGSSPGQGQ